MMKISVVLLIIVLTFSAIVPVSGGVPKKLQKLYIQDATRVNGWWPYFYDSDINAFVWWVSVAETFYIEHGWYVDDTVESIASYPNRGWFGLGHPLSVKIVVDSQEKQNRYSSGTEHYDQDGESWIFHLWAFYRIFKPGELDVGDYSFNVYYSAADMEYDTVAEKWVKLKEPFTMNILDNMQNWEDLPGPVNSLIIRVYEP
jgi:hypothetical protein